MYIHLFVSVKGLVVCIQPHSQYYYTHTHTQLVRWVVDHMADGLKKQQLRDLLKEGNVKVKFRSYNWDLNSA